MLLHHCLSRPTSLPTVATNAAANKGSLLLDMTEMRRAAMLCKLSVSASLDSTSSTLTALAITATFSIFARFFRASSTMTSTSADFPKSTSMHCSLHFASNLRTSPKTSLALLLLLLPLAISALGLHASQATLSLASRTNFADGTRHRVPTHTDSAGGHTSNFTQKAVAP
jgi:hypothetical protein